MQVLQIIKCDTELFAKRRDKYGWVVERDRELSLNRGRRRNVITVLPGGHLVFGNVESFVDNLWYGFDLSA